MLRYPLLLLGCAPTWYETDAYFLFRQLAFPQWGKKIKDVWTEHVAVRQENDWLGGYKTIGKKCVLMCVIGCARSWSWVGRRKRRWKCVLLSGVFLQHQHEWKGLLASCTTNSESMSDSKHAALYLLYLLFKWNKRRFSTKSFIMIQIMMGISGYVIIVVKPVYLIFFRSHEHIWWEDNVLLFEMLPIHHNSSGHHWHFLSVSCPSYFAIFFGFFSFS